MGTAYATLGELTMITGASYTIEQEDRAETLLPLVSNLIRVEGRKYGVDVDAKIEADESYLSVVKLITCDVVSRAMRQSTTGDPMSQESQSGLGYTWSGTYAIPGGGVAMSLMNNEKKMLGFKRQRYGVMEIWDGSTEEQ